MEAPKIEKLLTTYNFTDKNDLSRIKYIVIHYVGATGGAEANCKLFASKYLGASAHYFVGFNGEIWQSVEDEDVAWHCGAKTYKHPECRNTNSIGIEMCVRNKGDLSATSKDWYYEDATVESTIKLTKYLMEKYNIDVDHVIRHYDVTGKICGNPYVYNYTKHTWDDFKIAISSKDQTSNQGSSSNNTNNESNLTKIVGKSVATASQMVAYIKKVNPAIPQSVINMIPYYISEGETENIRGDISFCQSCIETGNYTFEGSAVTLDQNNFCGMGVIKRGMKGNSFETPQLGIRAQIQHLKAYGSTDSLVNDCIDPRFKYVKRGCAEYVEWLGIQENPNKVGWASGAGYGSKILNILNNVLNTNGSSETVPSTPSNTTLITSSTPNNTMYRVRKSWEDATSQKGAYKVLENAKKCADENPGYYVFDENGKIVYISKLIIAPYKVKVSINDLCIRTGPGTNYPKSGKHTGIGTFTIVEESLGEGASKWGLLKSYQPKRNGWISLDFCQKI